MSEEEILFIIDQIRRMPLTPSEKVEALKSVLKEKGIEEKKEYYDRLFE